MGCARKTAVSACKIRTEKWQPIRGYDYNSLLIFEYRDKLLLDNVLRFNPVLIGEWLDDLLTERLPGAKWGLSQYVGMSRTRVGQFLVLVELPVETKTKLRGMPDLNEYQTRRLVGERAAAQAALN